MSTRPLIVGGDEFGEPEPELPSARLGAGVGFPSGQPRPAAPIDIPPASPAALLPAGSTPEGLAKAVLLIGHVDPSLSWDEQLLMARYVVNVLGESPLLAATAD